MKVNLGRARVGGRFDFGQLSMAFQDHDAPRNLKPLKPVGYESRDHRLCFDAEGSRLICKMPVLFLISDATDVAYHLCDGQFFCFHVPANALVSTHTHMAKENLYKFCFGPWNLSEGSDPYGPTTRPAQTFDWKLAQLKKHGFEAMMFHDDDAVPDIDTKSDQQVQKEARELKKRLDNEGVIPEMVAPRLWFSPMTIDGAYTSNDPKCRQYAIDRSLRCIDIANILGTDLIVLWLAREGSYIRESKDARRCIAWLVEALDKMLAHDKKIRLAIEPKPNEPMDHAYIPTIGHALAVAQIGRAHV